MMEGTVVEIVPSRSGAEVLVDIGIPIYTLITEDSLKNLGIREGNRIYLSFKANAVRFIT
jgi:molybdopterin-binding protein